MDTAGGYAEDRAGLQGEIREQGLSRAPGPWAATSETAVAALRAAGLRSGPAVLCSVGGLL